MLPHFKQRGWLLPGPGGGGRVQERGSGLVVVAEYPHTADSLHCNCFKLTRSYTLCPAAGRRTRGTPAPPSPPLGATTSRLKHARCVHQVSNRPDGPCSLHMRQRKQTVRGAACHGEPPCLSERTHLKRQPTCPSFASTRGRAAGCGRRRCRAPSGPQARSVHSARLPQHGLPVSTICLDAKDHPAPQRQRETKLSHHKPAEGS